MTPRAIAIRMLPFALIISATFTPVAALSFSRDPWQWPLGDRLIEHDFDLPTSEFGPGHRGIDLAGEVGDVVRAVAPGRVRFVGRINGVPIVSIDHGAERSTYQPVSAAVREGDAVEAGEVLGILLGSGSHCPRACLHLGRVEGDAYLDPTLNLSSQGRFRLIDPSGDPPAPPAGVGLGQLVRPLGGPITSPFGMRTHPITGVRKLHDGLDFGAPCSTSVHAATAGTVTRAGSDGAYGLSVHLDAGNALSTSYNHLSQVLVAPGDHVAGGDIVGRVGSTGLSTGCHLHFMVFENGVPKNPQNYL